MSLDLKTLVGTLERSTRGALERAAQRCLQLTHFEVEIEHLLLELIDIEGGDLACVLPHGAPRSIARSNSSSAAIPARRRSRAIS
jgi:type VI secretion system protein VasG